MTEHERHSSFRDVVEDVEETRRLPDTPQTRSPAYRLAFADNDFLLREDLRPVRLQLELLKTETLMSERGITSTIVMFGGARIPEPAKRAGAATATLGELSEYYDVARDFARRMTERSLQSGGRENVVATGGGPGVMEAGNRGAHDAGGDSVGFSIVLPREEAPNQYVTPELSFNFHYFAIRKMHFLMRAKAIAIFPGGFGTLDELFETLTLIQTGRMKRMPFLLFGTEFWQRIINWEAIAEAGTISRSDLDLISFVDSADDAVAIIDAWDAGR